MSTLDTNMGGKNFLSSRHNRKQTIDISTGSKLNVDSSSPSCLLSNKISLFKNINASKKTPGLLRGGGDLGSLEELNNHKRSHSILTGMQQSSLSPTDGVNLREFKIPVSIEDQKYFNNNKLYANIQKEKMALVSPRYNPENV
jgi:hypothetical protein